MMLSTLRIAAQCAARRSQPPLTFICRTGSSSASRGMGLGQRLRAIKVEPVMAGRASESASSKGFAALRAGQMAAMAASGVALASLCWYSAGMNSEASALDRAPVWPAHVRQRIRDTYMYFGGSVGLTVVGAAAALRSPAALRLVSAYGWKSMVGSMVLLIGSGAVARSLPYQPGLGSKQLAWAVHSACVGLVLAPACMLGGQLVVRAAMYTGGIVTGLSALAMTAPSDKFLYMGGPLAMGSGVVMASCIGSWFLPAGSALGMGVYSIALYGGLVLFGGFLLYDTQKIMHQAELHPVEHSWAGGMGLQPYDPINQSMSVYMDTVNIFIRILAIVSGGGGRRK